MAATIALAMIGPMIYAFWRDTGPAQVRLEPGKVAEGWSEFLTEAGIDKDALPSSIDPNVLVVIWITGCMKFAFST
jgi:hypothetical protein